MKKTNFAEKKHVLPYRYTYSPFYTSIKNHQTTAVQRSIDHKKSMTLFLESAFTNR